MKIDRKALSTMVADKTRDGKNSKKLVDEVAAYLLENGQTSQLSSVMRDVWDSWAEHGRVEVVVVSARQITDKVRNDVKSKVRKLYPSAKEIIVSEEIDPTVKGGIRIELPNRQLDLTIETKLNKFKQLATAGKDN